MDLVGAIAPAQIVVARTTKERVIAYVAFDIVSIQAAIDKIIAIAPTQDAALFGFALLGLSVSPMLPLAYTAGASHDPDRSGRAIARINVFYYVGLLLGAPSIGLIAEASSMRMGFALIVAGPIVILALARAFRAPRL